jgi:hypothetical protein
VRLMQRWRRDALAQGAMTREKRAFIGFFHSCACVVEAERIDFVVVVRCDFATYYVDSRSEIDSLRLMFFSLSLSLCVLSLS